MTLLKARRCDHGVQAQLKPGYIGASLLQRRWIGIELDDQVSLVTLPTPPHQEAPTFIQSVEIEVDFMKGVVHTTEVYLLEEILSKGFR